MAVRILIDQPGAGAPPGVAGKSREDLRTGFDVQLTATGGAFLAYLWTIVDKPIDIVASSLSSAVLTTPAAATTLVTPVDVIGPYFIEVVVDAGFGLGAREEDIDRRVFFAGATLNYLNSNPAELPRREIAFQERIEHNVNDAIFPSGNTRGWAQEWLRWRAVYDRMYRGKSWSWGRVALPSGGPASVGQHLNVASATRTGLGQVAVLFSTPLTTSAYAVKANPIGPLGGSCVCDSFTTNGFTVYRADPFGALADSDFVFDVQQQVF